MFRFGLLEISSRKGSDGIQEPDMKVICKPILFKVSRNVAVNAGVISRSPYDPGEMSDSGLSISCHLTALANASKRFGRTAVWRTGRL